MSEQNSSGNFGARILIVLYGLGIVALGAYPIQREYGSVYNFLKVKAAAVEFKNPMRNFSRARLANPEVRTLRVPGSEHGNNGVTSNNSKDFDELTRTDRAELNELLGEID